MSFNIKQFIFMKPMKIKIETLLNSVPAMQELMNLKLPIVVSFKISKALRTVDKELTAFNEVKNKRIKELGEEIVVDGKPTGNWKVKEENSEAFNKEHKELVEKEVKLELPEIKISELGDVKIEASVLMNLDWLIKE